MEPELELRDYLSEDSPGIVALIAAVYAEYGDICEPQGFDRDLIEVQKFYLDKGGCFSVLQHGGVVAGSVAVLPKGDGICALKRLYLAKSLRGRGLGRRLMEHAMSWARSQGFRRMELWSDVRFKEAHGLYEKLGFLPGEGTRVLDDINASVEKPFSRDLTPLGPA